MFESDSESETENTTTAAKGKTGKAAIVEDNDQKEDEGPKDRPLEFVGEIQVVPGSPVQEPGKLAGENNLVSSWQAAQERGKLAGDLAQETGEFAGETQVIAGWPVVREATRENIPDAILPTQDPSTQEFHLALEVCLIFSSVCLFAFSFSFCLK